MKQVCQKTGKESFNKKNQAERVMRAMGRHSTRRRGKLNAFRCQFCEQWHIGRTSRNKK